MAKRIKNRRQRNLGAGQTGDVLAHFVPVSNPTCTCPMFETTRLPCLMLALQLPYAVPSTRPPSTSSADQQMQPGVRLRLDASRHPRAGCHPAWRVHVGGS